MVKGVFLCAYSPGAIIGLMSSYRIVGRSIGDRTNFSIVHPTTNGSHPYPSPHRHRVPPRHRKPDQSLPAFIAVQIALLILKAALPSLHLSISIIWPD